MCIDLLFALTTEAKTLAKVKTKLQHAVNQASLWYIDNKLVVNADKCDTLLISSKHLQSNTKLNITIDGTLIKQSTTVKYLGITIDNTLNWTPHITNICNKVRPMISMINRMRKYLPQSTLRTLYSAYIQPHIDYGITLWGQSPANHLNNLQHLQHFMGRIITNNFDYINCRGTDIIKPLNILNIRERYNYLLCCLTYKCLHDLAPFTISESLTKEFDVKSRPCRFDKIHNLIIPNSKTRKCEESFSIAGPTYWNKLPLLVKSSDSLNCFKHKYKQYVTNLI